MFPTLLVHMTGLDGFEVVGAIWYLSAMYLCMPMLYAIMRANKNLFVWVIAPLLTLFLYGYMHKVYGGIWIATVWTGICYGGIIFAIAGLSCGCFCYGVSEWLRCKSLTKLSRILISFLNWGMFILCLVLMQIHPNTTIDTTIAFLFALVVIMSFSRKSYTTIFLNRFCGTPLIREFSIAIYLCNARSYFILLKYFQELQSYELRLLLYVLFTMLLSFLCVIVVRLGKRWYAKHGRAIFQRLFLQDRNEFEC